MAVVISLAVLPLHAQVALLDATWQDYPGWDAGNETVAFRAPSLLNPDGPAYPGFAVATRPDTADGRLQEVQVEVWTGQHPDGMHQIHTGVLSVGRAGAVVGNGESRLVPANLPEGNWQLEIWVDAHDPEDISKVVFALPELGST
jgi:hypothetical protein